MLSCDEAATAVKSYAEVGTQTAEGEDWKDRYAGVWEVFDVPVMQVTEEIVHVEEIVDIGQIFSHERVEQIVDLAVSRIMEKIVQVIQLVPLERIKDQIVEQIVAVLVPQIEEDIVQVTQPVPQECVQNLVGKQIVDVPVSRRTVCSSCLSACKIVLREQIVDVPVPQTKEDGLQLVPERVHNRTLEQIVDVPVPQIKEGIVAGVQHVPQERVQNLVVEPGVCQCPRSRRMLWAVYTSYHRTRGKSGSSWTGQEDPEDPLRSRTLGRSSAPGKFSL